MNNICKKISNNLADNIRKDFKILSKSFNNKKLIYLDNAATSLKPISVVNSITEYYSDFTANIHRGRHMLSEIASDKFEFARSKVAVFIGAASNEVIFVRNTTEAINISRQIIGVSKNDLIVGFFDSHHSQSLPWMKSGNYKSVTIDSNFHADKSHFLEMLKLKPKVVVLTHCSNVTGSIQNIIEYTKLAKSAGSYVVIDAAQSVAHSKIKFSEIGCDFLAFSSHKMLGPSGVGCLIAKSEILEKSEPSMIGGGAVDFVNLDNYDLRKIPHRFESGTPAIEASFGLAAAIDYINEIGFDDIKTHEESLCETFMNEIDGVSSINLLGSHDIINRSPIFSLWFDGISNLKDITRALSDSYGIMCRNGHLCSQPMVDAFTDSEVLRFSAYIYNSPEDIRYAVNSLKNVLKKFS